MPHARRVLLDSVKSRLNGLPSSPAIYEAKVLAVNSAPAVAYEAVEDQVTDSFKGAGEVLEQHRRLRLEISALAYTPEQRDQLSLEIEQAMAPDLGKQSRLEGTELENNGDGERPLYGAFLTYSVDFVAVEDSPTT